MKPKKRNRQIKVIRRTQAEALLSAAVQKENGMDQILAGQTNIENEERPKPKNIDSTVLQWVAERRENSRIERLAAMDFLNGKALVAEQ